MPLVSIQLKQGRSVEQKRALVAKVTEAVCETVNVTPEKVRIVITDINLEDYGKAGILAIDKE
jgi:4-oxalocrotonate tautomerase